MAPRRDIALLLLGCALLFPGCDRGRPRGQEVAPPPPAPVAAPVAYQPPLGGLRQPAPVLPQEGPVYSIGTLPAAPPSLAAGEGRELVQGYCSPCHGTSYIGMQPPLPAAQWSAILDKMIRTFGAPVPPDVAPRILAYLQAHYTPETRTKSGARE